MDRNRLKQTETNKKGQKKTEIDYNKQKWTETERTGQKQKVMIQSGLKQTKTDRDRLKPDFLQTRVLIDQAGA